MDGVLLERDAECRVLEGAVDVAVSGSTSVVFVSGAAGLGKTRLMQRTRDAASQRGVRVLWARGSLLERDFPFGVVRQLFEPLVAEGSVAERERWFGGLAAAAEKAVGAGVSAEPAGEFAVLHGLFWLTSNLCRGGPLALLIDDLHWADEPSLRFVVHLLPRLEDLRVALVGGVRPNEPGAATRLLDVILTDSASQVLRLLPLSTQGSASLLEDMFAHHPQPGFAAACHRVTGGNPLLLTELARMARANVLEPIDGSIDAVLRLGAQGVSGWVRLQLSQLPREYAMLAEAIAVLAPRADLAIAAQLAGLNGKDALIAVSDLVAANLVQDDNEGSDGTFGFVHPLIQSAVYDQIRVERRIGYHAGAARHLRDLGAPLEGVAAHLLRLPPAGDPHTVEILRGAAQQALARGGAEAALTYLRHASAEPPSETDRPAVLAEAGLAAARVDLPTAADYLTKAIVNQPDSTARAALANVLGSVFMYVDRIDDAVTVFTNAINGLPPDQDDLRRTLQANLLITPGAATGINHVLDVLPQLRQLSPADTLGAQLLEGSIAICDTHRCEPIALERIRELATEPVVRAAAVQGLAAALSCCWPLVIARPDEGVAAVSMMVTEARRDGSLPVLLVCLFTRGQGLLACGELADAEVDLREVQRLVQLSGFVAVKPYMYALLAETLLEQGRVDEAVAVIKEAEPPVPLPRAGAYYWSLHAIARVLHAQDRYKEALETALAAGERYAAHGHARNPATVPWRSTAALCLHALGRQSEAAELAAEEVALARRWGAPHALGRALRIAGLLVPEPAGAALLREALQVLEGTPALLEHAKTLIDLGAMLRRSTARTEARTHLITGLDLATRCGAHLLAAHARTELRAAGGRPRHPKLTGIEALTPSEERIAALAATELTNRQIAQKLYVTVKTVEVHLSSVYRKLSITRRNQLPAILARQQN